MKICFKVNIRAISVNAAYRRRGTYGLYLIPDAENYKQVLGLTAKQYINKPFSENVYMKIEFGFKGKRKRDIDGGLKLTLDALNSIVYEDDSQIVSLHVTKNTNTEEDYVYILAGDIAFI